MTCMSVKETFCRHKIVVGSFSFKSCFFRFLRHFAIRSEQFINAKKTLCGTNLSNLANLSTLYTSK
jgi:hypothetical protein